MGGIQGRSGQAENLVPTGIQSQTVQPVVSHYTDWATQPTLQETVGIKIYIQNRTMQFLTSSSYV